MRHSLSALLLALGASAVVACGRGDAAGPSGDDVGDPTADVNGIWYVTLSNFSGRGFTCNAHASIELSQSGSSFSGTFYENSEECRGPGSYGGLIPGDMIQDGVVTGRRISFIIYGSPGTHFSGTVAPDGRSMSGNGTMAGDFDDNRVALSGTWVAEK
jgi:hypothetical protein